jgi:uncharacterized protein
MIPQLPRHDATRYIHLDTRRCRGCGKCVRVCPQKVLSIVDLPSHRHAWIELSEKCIGCLQCVKACPHRSIQAVESGHDNAIG